MDLEHKAIERIKMASEMSLHHYGKPLICTYSGGKDSDVMLELFIRSGIPFEVHNKSHTWETAEDVYRWWLEDETVPGQLEFDINGEIREATI